MQALDTLNRRFASGRPSNSVASAGVVVFGVDTIAVMHGSNQPWNPSKWGRMRTPRGTLHTTGWVSTSVINILAPWMYRDNDNHGAIGLVLDPDVVHAALRCSFPWDGQTRKYTCIPGDGQTCLMGCMNSTSATMGISGWCGTPHASTQRVRIPELHDPPTCPYRPDALKDMMEHQLAIAEGFHGCKCCTWPGCPRYNELVLDPDVWVQSLPRTIKAIFFPSDGDPGLEAKARQVQNQFKEVFSTSKYAQGVPLLAYNPNSESAPFSLVHVNGLP